MLLRATPRSLRGLRPPLHTRSFRAVDYDSLFARSVAPATREAFWSGVAKEHVAWRRAPTQILDTSRGLEHARWFVDGELNITESCLDRHVAEGRGQQVAVLYDSPVTGQKQSVTYSELLSRVERFAAVLRDHGVGKGDRVVIYMPMILESAVAMLACARLGATHSVVFGGFAPHELAVRVDDAKPKAVVTASCGVEVARVVEYAPIVAAMLDQIKTEAPVVICKHRDPTPVRPDVPTRAKVASAFKPTTKIVDWDEAEQRSASRPAKAVPVPSTHPLYVLYTSGTTGTPKGIVRDTGGYAAALGVSMTKFMQVQRGDTYFCSSDVGWVVGHNYIVYGPLLNGLTTVLFEGKPVNTPDAGTFWRVVEEYRANHLYTAPTALRAIRRADPDLKLAKQRDLSSLKAIFLAGERADPDTVKAYVDKLRIPLVDNLWQTESGSPMTGYQTPSVGVVPGAAGKPCFGFDFRVLAEEGGQPVQQGEQGMLCVKLPLPPGALLTVYNNEPRYLSAYMKQYPGHYCLGDVGFVDKNGYVTVMSRSDDLLNVAGHRLSSGTIEAAVMGHPKVAECACVGAPNSLKGEVCMGLVVLQAGHEKDAGAIEKELIKRVRDVVGPVASFHDCFVVPALPKTRSGKIVRALIKKIAAGDPKWLAAVPPTIEDVNVAHEVAKIVGERFKRD